MIDAERVSVIYHHAAGKDWDRLPRWVVDPYDRGEVSFFDYPPRIIVETLEGTMVAEPEDMLICGIQGELYPCKPDIFAKTYELVEGE